MTLESDFYPHREQDQSHRAGLRLSPAQLSRTYWNAEPQAFEYCNEATLEISGEGEVLGID